MVMKRKNLAKCRNIKVRDGEIAKQEDLPSEVVKPLKKDETGIKWNISGSMIFILRSLEELTEELEEITSRIDKLEKHET